MKTFFSILLLFLSCSGIKAQENTDTTKVFLRPNYFETHKRFSVVAAYNGAFYQYAELGFALNEYGVAGHHPIAWALSASCEMRVDKTTLYAPKLSAWIAGGSAFGVNMLYYMNGNEGSLRFRPEIGIGFNWAKLTYGYNIPLTNKRFAGINKHCVNLTVLIGIKKLKDVEQF